MSVGAIQSSSPANNITSKLTGTANPPSPELLNSLAQFQAQLNAASGELKPVKQGFNWLGLLSTIGVAASIFLGMRGHAFRRASIDAVAGDKIGKVISEFPTFKEFAKGNNALPGGAESNRIAMSVLRSQGPHDSPNTALGVYDLKNKAPIPPAGFPIDQESSRKLIDATGTHFYLSNDGKVELPLQPLRDIQRGFNYYLEKFTQPKTKKDSPEEQAG